MAEDRPDPFHPLDGYLREWGLEKYIPTFKEQAIDVETLQMLSENDINELIPIIGHRAKLKTQIKMLRAITALHGPTAMEISEDLSSLDEQATTYTYVVKPYKVALDDQVTDPPETSPLDDQVTDPPETSPLPCPDKFCELFHILSSTNDGKALLSRHKESGLLNNADRRRLCNIIINHELHEDPQKKITSTRLYELAYDIPKIFNKENSSVYFIPYMSISPKQKVSAKGKLLDCYRQRRREFIKSGIILDAKRRPSTSTNSSEAGSPRPETGSNIKEAVEQLQPITEDVNEKITWLSNCCDPWITVENYWEITAKQRLSELASTEITVQDYLRKYKPLNQPGGVFLLLKDFKTLYPLYDDKLHLNWSIVRPKLIDCAKKRQDTGLKEIIHITENNNNEELLNVVAFMTLPFLMTTSLLKTDRTKKAWRPSKHEVLQSFIYHLKSAAEIDETIERRKTKLQQIGLTFQPFIILVGPSIQEINARYIVLNHLRYELTTIVKCIDACFKLIFVLNMEYSAECGHVWQFIQKAIYKLNTKYDKVFTTVRTLATDLGLEL